MNGTGGDRETQFHYERLKGNSLILNFDNPNWTGHNSPTWIFDRTIQGLKRNLQEYLKRDEWDRPGRLELARHSLKEAEAAWAHYNAAQPFPKEAPTDHFAEQICIAQARLKLAEEEVERLKELLTEAEAREAQQGVQTQADVILNGDPTVRPRKVADMLTMMLTQVCPRCGKLELVQVDGRPVCSGKFMDVDTDLSWLPVPDEIKKISDVKEYVAAVRPLRVKASMERKAAREKAAKEFLQKQNTG